MTETEQKTHSVRIEVADDRLAAWICLCNADGPHAPVPREVVTALEETGVVVNDFVLQRINEFVALTVGDEDGPERFLIAEGRPATEGKDGEFLWHESFKESQRDLQDDAPVDYYTLNSVDMVEKDQPIGTFVPAVPGTDGVDVLGKTLTPTGHPKDVALDATVRLSDDDSTTVFADCAGTVVYKDGKLSISEVFEIKKDVDFESGNIDSPIDVRIGGTVLSRFAVKSKKAISVGGAIEAATVEANGDVTVRGGIIQRDEGSVSSGGDIIAKFCDGARLRATGNVKVAKDLIDSRVHCKEKLLVQGAVVGGQIYAREGAEVAELGNDTNLRTEITVGVDPNVLREVDHLRKGLKKKRMAVEHIRHAVQPLMANLKHLSATHKERATDLLFQADEADAEIAKAESEHSEMLDQAGATAVPHVLVSKVVHPGVTIRFGHQKTTFHEDVKGPVRIEERKIEEVTELVAVGQLDGSMTVLPSTRVVVKRPPKLPDLLKK